jgi:hypothetical protein
MAAVICVIKYISLAETEHLSEVIESYWKRRLQMAFEKEQFEAAGGEWEMGCRPLSRETTASFPSNREHAPLRLPPVLWRLALRRPMSASSPGHERAILI